MSQHGAAESRSKGLQAERGHATPGEYNRIMLGVQLTVGWGGAAKGWGVAALQQRLLHDDDRRV